MRSSSAGFRLRSLVPAGINPRRLKPALLVGLRQGRKLHAAADGVNTLGADADAVAEFPDVSGVRAAAAGFFLFPLLGRRGALGVAASGNDGVILLAVENMLPGEFLDAVDGYQALDENFRQFDEETEFLHGGNQRIVLFA